MSQLQIAASNLGRKVSCIDRIWLTIAMISALVAIVAPNQSAVSSLFALNALVDISPFLICAIGFTAYAKGTGADGLIARALRGQMSIMILLAAMLGGLSPLCSCGVIPLIAALLSMGVPIPAVMAFWLSSPLMDPSKFVIASEILGLDFAFALTVAAVGMGLIGGFATRLVMEYGAFSDPLRDGISTNCCGKNSILKEAPINWALWTESNRRELFWKEFIDTTLFLLKWLTLAFLLESLMLAYMPADFIGSALGTESTWAIPLAAIIGIPTYLNPFAAMPLIDGFINMGVVPGAGMAFLVSGAVTSLPAAIAVFALVKKGLFSWYFFLALSGALLSGLLFQAYTN